MKKILFLNLILFTSFNAKAESSYFPNIHIFESTVSAPKGLTVGEYNQDSSDIDGFACLSTDNKIAQLAFSSSKGFSIIPNALTSVGQNPVSVAAGDFAGDGKTKIAVFNQDSAESLIFTESTLNNAVLTFSIPINFPLDIVSPISLGGPESVITGLIDDQNNNPDVLVTADGGGLTNNGNVYLFHTIQSNSSYGLGGEAPQQTPNSNAIADFNGDLKADIAVTNTNPGTLSIRYGNGDGTFDRTNRPNIAVGEHPWGLAVADINGDAQPDVLTANRGDDSISVLLNAGDASGSLSVTQTITNVCDEPIDVELADFNYDQINDAAVLCAGDGFLKVYPGTATGTFETTAIFEKDLGDDAFDIVTADFNNDGHADILASVTGSNKIVTLLGNDEPKFSNFSFDSAAGLFSVTYSDADNEAPTTISITLDGTEHSLTEADSSDTNFVDGKVYSYTQSDLAVGSHTYKFAASDGTYDALTASGTTPDLTSDQTLTISPAASSSGGGCALSGVGNLGSGASWAISLLMMLGVRVSRKVKL